MGDPQKGAYTTDSSHSTGVPSGCTLNDVPAGNVLFYMNKTAGEGNIDAFKIVDSKNMIGNNPWKLELDIKLQSLMKYNTANSESGFSIMVNTGVYVNRINFAGDNKIRIETKWADPVPYFKETSVDLHLGDKNSHHWSIEGNGKGKIVINCDSIKVAEFDGILNADSYEPGLQFVNYYNDIVSGSNKIYFDNIELTTYVDNLGTNVTAGEPIDLGPMVTNGNALNLYSITTKNPVTGNDELYTVSTGSETKSSIFYALDPYTGEVLFQQEMPGTVHCYGIVQGSDKNIYVAGCDDGKLWRYTPGVSGQGKLDCVGINPSYSWVWDLAASNDGKIYGSTYDTAAGKAGEIFEYNIATGKFINLGPVKDGAAYVRGLGVTDNYIYAGVGMPDALMRINRNDLTKTEIAIPAFNGIPGTGQDGRMCAQVWAYNGKLFVRDNAMKLFILDEMSGTLLNTISFVQAISAP